MVERYPGSLHAFVVWYVVLHLVQVYLKFHHLIITFQEGVVLSA